MAILGARYTVDVDRTIRKSNILLRLFLCFDIFFLISAIVNLVWFSPAQAHDEILGPYRRHILLCMIGFFTTSFICNSLAIYGVSSWKRGFILPWLVFFSAVKIFLALAFISNVLNRPLNLDQLFLLLLLMSIMSAWRHMQVHYILMGLPRPSFVITDVEGNNGKPNERDLPPKYEDVAEIPPKYDEATMKPSEP
eukprot:TRINITY_DN1539_c0_g1_i1.p1 TRINITY_DN1539_c0_g1~~TRINITY_DN1539_c0_g1_i1.p1  ORF type:complete len:195 (-),score=33.93 TRINITY_DN1539_c0_g1_i1:253-837(-)